MTRMADFKMKRGKIRTYFLLIILFFTGCGRSPQHISEEKETVESLIHILKSDAAAHIRAEAAHR